MTAHLVLSLFPGIGLLDLAFELEGFTVVRGPDVLWGGDIRRFHPPAGVFDGVIGGPPCQSFSRLANIVRAQGHEPKFGNLIPEFERCVAEAEPKWFVMEEVPAAPVPEVDGYAVHVQRLNNRWIGAEQNRERLISFGTRDGRKLHVQYAALEAPLVAPAVISDRAVPRSRRQWMPDAVTAAHGGWRRTHASSITGGRIVRYTIEEACRLQGMPEDVVETFIQHAPFRADAKLKAVANGVPIPMGRAIARAVREAIARPERVA